MIRAAITADNAIDLDLSGYETSTGTTTDGVDYATFRSPGRRAVMGFGSVATALVLSGRAVGWAVQRGGVTKVVALSTPSGAIGEDGEPVGIAA